MSNHRASEDWLPSDIKANLDHATRLQDKIAKLNAALTDSVRALVQSVERHPMTTDEAVEIYLRTQGMPNQNDICAATGWTTTKIRYFIREQEKREKLGRSYIPPDGVHCVYVLFRHGVCVYVGRSKSVRKRLKTHQKNGNVFDYIEVYSTRTLDESRDLEAILQQQHRPIRNKRTEMRVA